MCVSVEDEEAASCNLHDFGYVASTAVSPIRQLGLGERETIFRLLYERVMPWPSDNTHAPTSIHAMRRIRTALTHTHGAGGTAFTKKKKKHLEMAASSASAPLPGSASGCQRRIRMGARGTGRPPAGEVGAREARCSRRPLNIGQPARSSTPRRACGGRWPVAAAVTQEARTGARQAEAATSSEAVSPPPPQ